MEYFNLYTRGIHANTQSVRWMPCSVNNEFEFSWGLTEHHIRQVASPSLEKLRRWNQSCIRGQPAFVKMGTPTVWDIYLNRGSWCCWTSQRSCLCWYHEPGSLWEMTLSWRCSIQCQFTTAATWRAFSTALRQSVCEKSYWRSSRITEALVEAQGVFGSSWRVKELLRSFFFRHWKSCRTLGQVSRTLTRVPEVCGQFLWVIKESVGVSGFSIIGSPGTHWYTASADTEQLLLYLMLTGHMISGSHGRSPSSGKMERAIAPTSPSLRKSWSKLWNYSSWSLMLPWRQQVSC